QIVYLEFRGPTYSLTQPDPLDEGGGVPEMPSPEPGHTFAADPDATYAEARELANEIDSLLF
ncbi:MAG: hypothetical protein AAF568_02845, partial [Pseudomonadota bacterium]